MRNLKSQFREIVTLMFGGFLQNKDNNYSLENQWENEILTKEFETRREQILIDNQIATFDKLLSYIIAVTYKNDNFLMGVEQAKKEAAQMYRNYRQAGLIDNDCKLIKSIDEAITEIIG